MKVFIKISISESDDTRVNVFSIQYYSKYNSNQCYIKLKDGNILYLKESIEELDLKVKKAYENK